MCVRRHWSWFKRQLKINRRRCKTLKICHSINHCKCSFIFTSFIFSSHPHSKMFFYSPFAFFLAHAVRLFRKYTVWNCVYSLYAFSIRLSNHRRLTHITGLYVRLVRMQWIYKNLSMDTCEWMPLKLKRYFLFACCPVCLFICCCFF